MIELKSITTFYISSEDRICILGMGDGATAVTIWLTLSQMQRLVPPLLRWLEQQSGTGLPHSFAQQAAKAQTPPRAAVAAGIDSVSWLVTRIELAFADRVIRITLNGAASKTARLSLTPVLLSQWLVIVYKAYCMAGWPLVVWPVWMGEFTLTQKPPATAMH